MSKPQLIKRVVQGGYIKADTTGAGNWEVGKITKANDRYVFFTSAADGEEVQVVRTEAYKATAEEYKQALKDAQRTEDTRKAKFVASVQKRIAEEDEAPTPVGMTDMEDEPEDLGEDDSDEDAQRNASMIDPKYKQMYGTIVIQGRRTQICGDETSKELAAMELIDTYRLVSRECNLDFNVLVHKYAHLNPGQQKMCLSNRLRAHRRKLAKKAEDKALETGDFLAEQEVE